MKKLVFCSFLFITTFLLHAQSSYFNIVETQGIPGQNSTSTIEAVHITPNEEVAVSYTGKKKLLFDIYDKDGNKVFNKYSILEKKEHVIGHVKGDGTIKVFTVAKPSKTERQVKCHILNLEDKSHRIVPLFQTTVEKKQALFSGQNKRQTNFAVSPTGNYLTIATDNVKRNSNSYNVYLYDANSLDQIFEKKFFENPEKFFKSFDIAVDDSGTIYSVGKEYKDGKAEKSGENPNYSIIVNKVSDSENTSSRIALDEDHHVADLKIVLKENRIDLYGFYSKRRAGKITGLSKISIDKGNIQNHDIKQTKLPQSVLTDIYPDQKAESKKDKDLKNYYLDYVVEDEYGNTTLLAEEFFISQTYVSNGEFGGYTMTTFHYNNILILNLNDRGDVVWGRSIFKAANEPSYNAFVHDSKLHVLFNTGKKLKVKDDGRVKARKGWLQSTALFDYIYDQNGTVVQEKLRDNKGSDKYEPRNGAFQNGKFIMFNSSNLNKKLMILNPKSKEE